MNRARPAAWLLPLIATIIAAPGCRSYFGQTRAPEPIAPAVGFEVRDAIDQHNRDALRVTTYEATPAVSIQPGKGRIGTLPGGAASGNLYVEPGSRNFRMLLKYALTERIDVGSNNDRIWVWSPDTFGTNDVYTCGYDETGDVPLPALYQPDWIMEAMGLSALPQPGAPGVTVRSEGGDAVLEQRRTGADGNTVIKETVVSGLTRKVTEHRLLLADKTGRKELAAQARVKTYETYTIPQPDGQTTIELPSSFQLFIPAERLDMTMAVKRVKINQGFDRDQQARLFNPSGRGNAPMQDLRAALGMPSESTTRETMPAPPTGVRLQEPVPPTSAANDAKTDPGSSPSPSPTRTANPGRTRWGQAASAGTAADAPLSANATNASPNGAANLDLPRPTRTVADTRESPMQSFVGAGIPRPPR